MKRSLTLALLCALLASPSAAAAGKAAKTPPPPFTVVEATIPEMQKALAEAPRDLARAGPAVPRPHRDLRGQAQRRHHREPEGARRGGRARPRARAEEDPRPAARHPDRAQGQHPHHEHAHHRRRARLRRLRPALRGDGDEEPARRGRDHHRQDGHDRARELGGGRALPDAHELQRGSTATASIPTIRGAIRARPPSTAGPALATGGSSSGIGTAASFWAANVGTETTGSILSPSNQNMLAGIKPTVGRISRYGIIPITADQDTAGPMAKTVTDAAILLGALEGAAPDAERSRHQDLHASARPRLHEVPEGGRAQGRAHRHPARVLLRQDHRRPAPPSPAAASPRSRRR